MTNNITYNQLIDIFKDIADRHLQLNDYFSGTIEQFSGRINKYPILVTTPAPSMLTKSNNLFNTTIFSFNIFLADLVNNDNNNDNDVRSDTHQIICDIISELSQHKFYRDNDIIISNDIDLNPFIDRFSDQVAGWYFTLLLKVPYRYNYCQSPSFPKDNSEIIGRC